MATSTRTGRRVAKAAAKSRPRKSTKSVTRSKTARARTASKAARPARKATAARRASTTQKRSQPKKATASRTAAKKAGAKKTPVRKPGRSVSKRVSIRPDHQLVLAAPSSLGPRWSEKLRDGTHVMIRPIRKTDAEIERKFIERLSDVSRRFRFLGLIKSPSPELIRQLTDIDYKRDMAFVALVHDSGETREVGVSRFSVAPDGTSSECAVVVADEWQGRGLGTLLMRHLVEVARSRGIRRMISIDASENTHMRELANFLGFHSQRDPDDAHQVIYSLEL